MVDWALEYQKLGFSVIPISPTKKTPLIKFADLPPMSPEQIKETWTEHPNANIALKTDKFFVIDIDKHGSSNGFDSLRKWKNVKLIPQTLQAKTASGGKHLFFFKRDDRPISQLIGFLPGVDIKAHNNNYVLVAPSANSKGVYEWDIEKSGPHGTMVTASRELIDAINAESKSSTGLKDLMFRTYNGDGKKNKTTDLFETIIIGFGDEGGRNDALAKFTAGLLLRKVDYEHIYSLAKIANSNSMNPLPDKELSRTVESMIKKDRR